MHGLILSELQRFAQATAGEPAWRDLLRAAAITDEQAYSPRQLYPDAEMAALTAALGRLTGRDEQELLGQFGEFVAPTLLLRYRQYLKPGWKTLDVIEHAEENIHRAVRVRDPGAAPPQLEARRVNATEVVVIYRSARRMCGFAKGIAHGVARHFGETVTIDDLSCMLKGKPTCTLAVKLA